MRTWLLLLSGFLIWTAHFFGVYVAASLFPGTALAKWLTAILTLAAMFMLVPAWRRLGRVHAGAKEDGISSWIESLARLSIALAALAIVYGALPALTS